MKVTGQGELRRRAIVPGIGIQSPFAPVFPLMPIGSEMLRGRDSLICCGRAG